MSVSRLGEEGLRLVRRRSPPSLILTRLARSPHLAKPNPTCGPGHFSIFVLTYPSLPARGPRRSLLCPW